MAGFSINTVVISGNLTRDPEMRSLPNGGPTVCELGVAVNERIKNQHTGEWEDRPNYFDVTVWSGMGEWAGRSLHKGAGVVIEGRLRYESWETDGQKRSKVKIVANSIVPRDRGNEGGGGGEFRASRSDVPTNQDDFAPPAPAPAAVGGGGGDEDIPF